MRKGIAKTKEYKSGEEGERALIDILPTYGIETHSLTLNPLTRAEEEYDDAPKIRLDGSLFRLPDLLCFEGSEIFYSEAKSYHAPSWRRIEKRWEHIMPMNEFRDFREIQARTGIRIYVFILERFCGFSFPEEEERWTKERRSRTPKVLWATLDEINVAKRVGQDPETLENFTAVYFPRSILRELCEWNPALYKTADEEN